jgi:two-component system cell cycle response regulator
MKDLQEGWSEKPMESDRIMVSQEEITILVVEDSLTQAVRLQSLLEENGYRTLLAENGRAALERVWAEPPTLIISDIVMPEMDGYELCRRIKSNERTAHIPVMLVTQLNEPEDILKGLDCGADNFITKPYDAPFLLSRIQYILINRKLRKNTRTDMGLEVFFANRRHFINSDRIQILDLLFSTYESALQKARELERVNRELQEALDTIKTLEGILPICSSCKKIRDGEGVWQSLERYIGDRSKAKFSHGICPECARKLYPDIFDK